MAMSLPSMIAFGSQIEHLDAEYLSSIRTSLLENSNTAPLVQAIIELPATWSSFTESYVPLQQIPGQVILEKLRQWIECGTQISFTDPQQNILLTPLTLITQLVEYLSFLQNESNGAKHADMIASSKANGFQGLCIGLLSAITLASATDEKELVAQAVTALHIAVLIGATVDLDSWFAEPQQGMASLVVRMRTASDADISKIIGERYPESYVAVISDELTATITLPRSRACSITNDLIAHGLDVKELGLRGRFHTMAHFTAVKALLKLCEEHSDLQFHPKQKMIAPVRSGVDGEVMSGYNPYQQVIQEILLWTCNWHLILSKTLPVMREADDKYALCIGYTKPITHSTAKRYGTKVIHADHVHRMSRVVANTSKYPDHAVAVVGMGCRFPGSASPSHFWELLTSCCSMASKVPEHRFASKAEVYWGNFVEDIESFDHKFFSKSPREAAAMDPQQRILLQVAYQAIESAGWLGLPGGGVGREDIGCFIGCGSSDYNDNIASHAPSAFSILGALRGLLSGRISHHFGWEGPSITYDTACASSMVAIDAACKALQLRECKAAVAGGVNVLTSPNYYQSLDAAGFLSKSGPSRAFDAGADGYCRGEGAGLVVLKRLDDALSHGDNILGVLAGTAIMQNGNGASINVPSLMSQTKLFDKVLARAGLNAAQVSFVEAHGTGTQVGDCIEAESVRRVFGGSDRPEPLWLGSVKDNIGHTEGAAGVAGLIKALLMIRHDLIVPQPGFATLNPNIAPLETDNIQIPRHTSKAWTSASKAVCVNNYGAGGCNGALVVGPPPAVPMHRHRNISGYPIFIGANSITSLRAYCDTLRCYLESLRPCVDEQTLVANVAFHLSRTQNRDVSNRLIFTVVNVRDLCSQLKQYAKSCPSQSLVERPLNDLRKANSVVLIFGGQTGQPVGVSSELIASHPLLRSHLDNCNAKLMKLGYKPLSEAFSSEDPNDLVSAHSALFSVQYATAKCWLDCGLQVDAVLGHSFGQLTALCVAGVLSLEDGLKLAVGRAALMQNHWGPDPGAMVAIEGDTQHILGLLRTVSASCLHPKPEVACYNGPSSFVLAGSVALIEAVHKLASNTSGVSNVIKTRRLEIPRGFHSHLTEPVLDQLTVLAESVTYRLPIIPIETCSDESSWTSVDARDIVDHTRSPVYFDQAVKRLDARLGPCTWLEAGTDSPIIGMVRRALGSHGQSTHAFQPVRLNAGDQNLSQVTASLWAKNHRHFFWGFHQSLQHQFDPFDLPPYIFDRSSHWLPYVDLGSKARTRDDEKDLPQFCSFGGYLDADRRSANFNVHARNERFSLLVQGHAVLDIPLCPASTYMDIVTQAAEALMVRLGVSAIDLVPSFKNFTIHAPLGLDESRAIKVTLTQHEDESYSWIFEVVTRGSDHLATRHASGKVSFHGPHGTRAFPLASLERLVDINACKALLKEKQTQAVHGPVIYRLFRTTVTYASCYQGVRSIASSYREAAATVALPSQEHRSLRRSACDPLAIDNFLQVAGIHINFLNEFLKDEIYIASSIHEVVFRDKDALGERDREWAVYSKFGPIEDRTVTADIFVFSSTSQKLNMVILGVRFTRVHVTTLSRILLQANSSRNVQIEAPSLPTIAVCPPIADPQPSNVLDSRQGHTQNETSTLQKLFSDILDVPSETLEGCTTFADLGVDSLMMTEVASSLRQAYGINISTAELQMIPDLQTLSARLFPTAEHTTDRTPLRSASSVSTNPSNISEMSTLSHTLSIALSSTGTLSHEDNDMGPCGPEEVFEILRTKFDKFAVENGFDTYWDKVFPQHSRLVTTYIVEAFSTLGCALETLGAGDLVPPIQVHPQHAKLLSRLIEILEEDGLISKDLEGCLVRTKQQLEWHSSSALHKTVADAFPAYAQEHQLLRITGQRLAACLTGEEQGMDLLFGTKTNRELLKDVYALAPVFKTATALLTRFLEDAFSSLLIVTPIQILEVGAGTGATTTSLIDALERVGVPFTYTFTDVSASMVSKAKQKLGSKKVLEFQVLDIEKPVPVGLHSRYDAIVSTNCIHATPNLVTSVANIRKMLKPQGFVALVELTRKMPWFDLVFGLLEGWWAFTDNRSHAIANEGVWSDVLQGAGFTQVKWSTGTLKESSNIRVICGFQDARVGMRTPSTEYRASSILLQGDASRSTRRIFAFPGGFGTAATYTPLPPLHSSLAVFGLNSPFLKAPLAFDISLTELTSLYLDEILRQQPVGPYTLAGYSVGGVLAYEAARQLLLQGEKVDQLILLDSACPALVPPFPLSLLDFFDSIDRFNGTEQHYEDKQPAGAESGVSSNGAKKMSDPHVTATLRCLHRYRPTSMPVGQAPRTLLIATRHGVDRMRRVPRPEVSEMDQRVIEWVLDDRTDFSASGFGWDRLIPADMIEVVPVDGNHFSLMTKPYITIVAQELRNRLGL